MTYSNHMQVDPVYNQLSGIRDDMRSAQSYFSPQQQYMGGYPGSQNMVNTILNPAPPPPPFSNDSVYEATLFGDRASTAQAVGAAYATSQQNYQQEKAKMGAILQGVAAAGFFVNPLVGMGLSMAAPVITDLIVDDPEPVLDLAELRKSNIAGLVHRAAFENLDSFTIGGVGGMTVGAARGVGADIQGAMQAQGFAGEELDRLLGGMTQSGYLEGVGNVQELTGRMKEYIKTVADFVKDTSASLEEAGQAIGMGMQAGIGRDNMDKFLGGAALFSDVANVKVGDYLQTAGQLASPWGQAGLDTSAIFETFGAGIARTRAGHLMGDISDVTMLQMGGAVGVQSFLQNMGQNYWQSSANKKLMAAMSVGDTFNFDVFEGIASGDGVPDDFMDVYNDLDDEDKLKAQWRASEFALENTGMMTSAMMGSLINQMEDDGITDPDAQAQWLVNRGMDRNQASTAISTYTTRHGWGTAYTALEGTYATSQTQEYASTMTGIQGAIGRALGISKGMQTASRGAVAESLQSGVDWATLVANPIAVGHDGNFREEISPGLFAKGDFYLSSVTPALAGLPEESREDVARLMFEALEGLGEVNLRGNSWGPDATGYRSFEITSDLKYKIGSEVFDTAEEAFEFWTSSEEYSIYGARHNVYIDEEEWANIGSAFTDAIAAESNTRTQQAESELDTSIIGQRLVNTAGEMEVMSWIMGGGLLSNNQGATGRANAWATSMEAFQMAVKLPTGADITTMRGQRVLGTLPGQNDPFFTTLYDAYQAGGIDIGGALDDTSQSMLDALKEAGIIDTASFGYLSESEKRLFTQFGGMYIPGQFNSDNIDIEGRVESLIAAGNAVYGDTDTFSTDNLNYLKSLRGQFELDEHQWSRIGIGITAMGLQNKTPSDIINAMDYNEVEASAFESVLIHTGDMTWSERGRLLTGGGLLLNSSLINQKLQPIADAMNMTVQEMITNQNRSWSGQVPEEFSKYSEFLVTGGEIDPKFFSMLMEEVSDEIAGGDAGGGTYGMNFTGGAMIQTEGDVTVVGNTVTATTTNDDDGSVETEATEGTN